MIRRITNLLMTKAIKDTMLKNEREGRGSEQAQGDGEGTHGRIVPRGDRKKSLPPHPSPASAMASRWSRRSVLTASRARHRSALEVEEISVRNQKR